MKIKIERAGGYDPARGPAHPDNRDPSLEASVRARSAVSDANTRVVGDPEAPAARLDLDEIERLARAAEQSMWTTPDARGRIPAYTSRFAIVYADSGEQVADAYDNTGWSDDQCFANAQHIAAASPPVVLALIARIRKLEAETAHQHNVMSEHATICNKRVAGIEAIAKTATEFIDEQGPRASEDLLLHPDFASAHWEELVRAVEGAGR